MTTTVGGVVKFLGDRELGVARVKFRQNDHRSGDIVQQVTEDKATIPTKNQACDFSGETRSTFLVTFSADGTKMASAHGDHAVRVTDLASGKCLHTLKGHPRTPWCIAFHPVSNDILASGCLGGEVRIWDLRGGGSEVWRSEKSVSIASIAFHPTDQVLVFAVANELHFWDWTQTEPFATVSTTYEYEKIRWVRFDPCGYHLYTGIGNGVSVQAEEPQVGHVGSTVGRHSAEERVQLQNQYRRILEEIQQFRRERFLNEQAGSWSNSAAPATQSNRTSNRNTENSEGSVPRLPSPVHVDALVSARMYASAVTNSRAHQTRASDVSTTHTSFQSLPGTRATTVVSSSQSGSSSNGANPPQPGDSRPSQDASGALMIPSSQPDGSSGRNMSSLSMSYRQRRRLGRRPHSSILYSSLTEQPSLLIPTASPTFPSRLSSFLRSQLTSVAETSISNTTTAESGQVTSTATVQSSSQSNAIQPVTVVSMSQPASRSCPSPPVFRPVGSLSSNSPNVISTSAFRAQSASAEAPSRPVSGMSESVRGRFLSYLNRQNREGDGHYRCSTGECEVCLRYRTTDRPGSSWNSSSSTVPILPSRVSRSTASGREAATGSSRPRPRYRRLTSMLESEVRRALTQVRARRLDISETLRDLNNLRSELGHHNCGGRSQEGSNEHSANDPATDDVLSPQPGSSQSALIDEPSSSQDSAPVTEGAASHSDPLVAASHSGEGEALVDSEPSTSSGVSVAAAAVADSGGVDDDDDAMDLDSLSQGSSTSTSSMSSMESLPSSQEDSSRGQISDSTLTAIGNYSSEIERRVHELNTRISAIHSRLEARLRALQEHREQRQQQTLVTSTRMPRLIRAGERIRQRNECLRSRVERLRRRYHNRLGGVRDRIGSSSSRHRHLASAQAASGQQEGSLSEQQQPAQADSAASRPLEIQVTRSAQLPQSPTASTVHWYPNNGNLSENMSRVRASSLRRLQERSSWLSLQRRHLHPHYAVSILDETVNQAGEGLQAAINRAIAGAFVASGDTNVASNIINTSFRIQRWEFSRGHIPDIKNSEENVIVPHCKLHNDGFCDLSKDGRYLAVFVPSHNGFPDDSVLAVFSLATDSFRQCLFTKSFGPNFVSVSISPLNNYLLVGLATRRMAWVFTPRQMVAQVFKLKSPDAGEDSMEHICDLMHPCDMDIRTPVSVNCARWMPYVGEGIVYGTNRGDLHICRPGFEQEKKPNDPDLQQELPRTRPSWMSHMMGLNLPRTASTATQTIQRVRRTASTQTDQLVPEEAV